MRRLNLLLTALICIVFFRVSAQHVFKTTPTSVIGYLEYVPADYNANSNKYPIMIFLHGIGERGQNSTDPAIIGQNINLVARHGPPKYVNAGTQFPFILISPQLKNNYGSWPTSYIMEVINHVKTYLRVDERRIYLTGLSLGGGGAWGAAQDYPELFAALAPVCGGYNTPSKACGMASENMPVWAFHGDKDTTVPLSRTESMVNAINACVPAPSPLAKLTVYAGVGHNAWDNAYRIDNLIHTPNVYDWFMSYTNVFNKGNRIPIANAGTDKTITQATSTLIGSGSDTDGTITSYVWTKISGPSAVLSNITSSTLNMSSLVEGDYVFRLTVTDNSGNNDSDYVKVTVSFALKNELPVANAGVDRTITVPNSAVINGSGTDIDGTIVSYEWTKVSGNTATITGATTSTLTASGLSLGNYVFRLTVTDNAGGKHSDDMTLTVNPALPVVNAGADKVVKLPMNGTVLSGSATDADGSITTYLWTKVSGGTCSMSSTNASYLNLSNLISGNYVFRLTATDNSGYIGSDEVTVIVDAPPVVNAGDDQTLKLPQSSMVLNGSATDPDGNIVKYLWSKHSGPNFICGPTDGSSFSLNKLYEGVYVFRLVVTDHLGAQGIDYVTVTVTSESDPVVNAGADAVVRLPMNSITLQGTATDADGTIASYQWTKISGGSCGMYNTATPSMNVVNFVAGTYTFRLTATDNSGRVGSDDVIVIVDAPPVANAGPDITLTLPACSAVLNGSGTDSDGTIVKYLWSKHSGPNFVCGATDGASFSLNKLYEGVYVFRLTVTDDLGAQGIDYVTVKVISPTSSTQTSSSTGSVSTARMASSDLAETNFSSHDDQILGKKTREDLEGCTVIIFSDSGKQIYKGKWTKETNHEILNSRGLYIYNVLREGVRIDAGKIYIKDI